MSISPFDQDAPVQPEQSPGPQAVETKVGSRQRKNERDAAQYALDVETRRVAALKARAEKATTEAERLNLQLTASEARRAHFANHPALQG